MCQSKSEGGIRCESHIQKSMTDHQIAFSNLVQQECMANGVLIDPAYFELSPDDHSHVNSQLGTNTTAKKARLDAITAKNNLNVLRGTLIDALTSGDTRIFASLIRENDPELQAIDVDNAARKRKLAEDMARITDEKEKDEAIANNKNVIASLKDRKAKLNALSKKRATEATNIYIATGDATRAVSYLACMQQANKDTRDIRDKALATIKRERKRLEEITIAYKVRNDPGFRDAMSSPSFVTSPVYQNWEAKNKELWTSLSMTPGYQNDLKVKISSYKKAGINTAEMEAAHKELTIRKAKLAYDNIAEFHGTSSTEAKAAASAYHAATQKVHVY